MIRLCGISAYVNIFGADISDSNMKCLSCLYHHNLKHSPLFLLAGLATNMLGWVGSSFIDLRRCSDLEPHSIE